MSCLKRLDIFGSPFQFEMGVGNNKRQTNFGGCISLLVIIAALTYFIYLNYKFGSGEIQPKITSQLKKITSNFFLPIQPNYIYFDIYNQDTQQNLMLWQKQQGKQLISYKATLLQSDDNGNMLPQIDIPINYCSNLTDDENIDLTSQCLDFSSFDQDHAQFKTFSKEGVDTKIYIQINAVCSSSQVSDCLYSQVFEDQVFSQANSFCFTVNQKQFNTDSQDLEPKQQDIFFNLDPTLLTNSQITLQVSKTSMQEGFLISKTTQYTHLSDVSSQESFRSRGATSSTQNTPLIAEFYISLSGTQYNQTIQYPQYPEILAQFVSILNVLLLLGVIGGIVSKTDIQQYFIDLKLKEYYKQTAYKFLKKSEQNEEVILHSKLNKDDILKANKYIEQKDLNEELSKKFKVSMFQRILRTIIGEEKEDYNKKKRSDKDLYEALFYQASQSQDVFEIQSELMRIRKILAMLITPQQYAAIKCCGASVNDQIPFLLERNQTNKSKVAATTEKFSKNDIPDLESQSSQLFNLQFNQIELMDKIDYDEQYFQSQLEKFIQDSERGFENYDEQDRKVNQRLLDCLNKTYN
ncbi:transmembrane protein, putative (macronuclear) [Tetrahymena thermophila SB210]|uniref:Transmembrane protein, putative n=1 Tax=Tetrahymena thermophila (strain SB210) TaxID=312017 RepID=Q24D77_TETTS|nr:transmembrane protein, putative [Tetrahymena thermophila SB210]EAS05712.1 transmembrane protein, putative [Tetrahymena thermophila SB210]|eukprot:XP_001025957.1 transmembrane protein, putative [Tetrahymena thermophila SB210]